MNWLDAAKNWRALVQKVKDFLQGKPRIKKGITFLRKTIIKALDSGSVQVVIFITASSCSFGYYQLYYNPPIEVVITGTVYDDFYEDLPLSGIPVFVKDSPKEVLTDSTGGFFITINCRKRDEILSIGCGGRYSYPIRLKNIDIPKNKPRVFTTIFHLKSLNGYSDNKEDEALTFGF